MREDFESYLKVLAGFRRLIETGHKGAIASLGGRPWRVRAVAATGTPVPPGQLTAKRVAAMFAPDSETHDLGLVILGGEFLAAHCQFPMPQYNKKWEDWVKRLGSRHRAAMGMSRATGAEVLILSEGGEIRIARGGRLFPLDSLT